MSYIKNMLSTIYHLFFNLPSLQDFYITQQNNFYKITQKTNIYTTEKQLPRNMYCIHMYSFASLRPHTLSKAMLHLSINRLKVFIIFHF